MKRIGYATGLALALLLGLSAAASAPPALAQETEEPQRSVHGSLDSVDVRGRTVVMSSDAGERLAWRVGAQVVERVAELEAGSPMIVIYRQVRADEKVATAVAFPGTAATPTYVNTTGGRVALRSGPGDERGECDQAAAVNEISILEGGQAETADACWCCSPAAEASCAPNIKTGPGRAFLLRCF